MNRRHVPTALVAALVAVLAPASSAHAQAAAPTPGGAQAVTDGSYALVASSDTLLGKATRFRGFAPAEDAGRTVTIERFEPITSGWVPVATSVVDSDGTFLAYWRTDHIGQFRLRARIDRDSGQAVAATATPEIGMTVYKPAVATWYGPGFYGRKTACGLRMTRRLVGVAHKQLPCGTRVAFLYQGRTLIVPVVDRGPFPRGRTWDLTAAAAKALGFTHTDTLGALSLRGEARR